MSTFTGGCLPDLAPLHHCRVQGAKSKIHKGDCPNELPLDPILFRHHSIAIVWSAEDNRLYWYEDSAF